MCVCARMPCMYFCARVCTPSLTCLISRMMAVLSCGPKWTVQGSPQRALERWAGEKGVQCDARGAALSGLAQQQEGRKGSRAILQRREETRTVVTSCWLGVPFYLKRHNAEQTYQISTLTAGEGDPVLLPDITLQEHSIVVDILAASQAADHLSVLLHDLYHLTHGCIHLKLLSQSRYVDRHSWDIQCTQWLL